VKSGQQAPINAAKVESLRDGTSKRSVNRMRNKRSQCANHLIS